MTDFAFNTCMFYPVLDCFGAAFYSFGKFYQFPIQIRAVFIRIGGVYRPLNVGGNRGIVARAFF
jgi:hypothetical protein